jgi:hypothetical protein
MAALTCNHVDPLLSGVSLQNDFTPEQEEEVRRENQWAFD